LLQLCGGREVANRPHNHVQATDVNIRRAKELVSENKRIMVRDIASVTYISVGSVEAIIYENFFSTQAHERWIRTTLTFDHKAQPVSVSEKILQKL
jgi:hypothetical protein